VIRAVLLGLLALFALFISTPRNALTSYPWTPDFYSTTSEDTQQEELWNEFIVILTDENFEEFIQNATLPVFVNVTAHWCAPCRWLEEPYNEYAKKYSDKAIFAIVESDENIATKERLRIKAIPTVILFENGVETERAVSMSQTRQGQGECTDLIDRFLESH